MDHLWNGRCKGVRMAIPDYQTLMLPVLRLAAEGEWRVPMAAEKIADEFALTEQEREELLPSGRQKLLHNRIHWAKFYMTKAGLIETPRRGVFRATDEGKAVLAKSPASIDNETLKAYPAFIAFQDTMFRGRWRASADLAWLSCAG